MKDGQFSLRHLYIYLCKVGRMYFLNLGVKHLLVKEVGGVTILVKRNSNQCLTFLRSLAENIILEVFSIGNRFGFLPFDFKFTRNNLSLLKITVRVVIQTNAIIAELIFFVLLQVVNLTSDTLHFFGEAAH